MKKMLKRRSGFTLVELLIVIIIIGILAGAMLLVAGSGTDKAEATKIVSNMRSLKAAALLYYADKAGADSITLPTVDNNADTGLEKYMDRKADSLTGYTIEAASGDQWYVDYTKSGLSSGIKGKLKDTAKASGLVNALGSTADYDGTGDSVFMRAR